MLSEVPEGWDKARIDAVLQRNTTSVSVTELAAEGLVAHYSLPAFDANKKPVIESGSEIKSNKTAIDKDCLLFSKLNPRIPRVWRVRHFGEQKPVCSTEFWALKPKTDEVSLSYAEYFLGWNGFLSHSSIKPASSTNSHQRVDRKAFDAFMLPLPPLNEQRRIAEILSSVDASIQATQAVIEQAERVKRGLMEELLTGGLGSEAIERGEVPEGWRLLPLGEFAKIKNGFAFKSKEFLSDDSADGDVLLVVRMSDFNGGYVDTSHCKRIQKTTANGLEKFRLKQGDILVAMSGATVGKLGRVPATANELYLNQRVGCMQPTQCSAEFLWQLVNTPFFQATVLAAATGNAQPNISSKELEKIEFALPPEDTQHRIVSALTAFDDFITKHKVIGEQQNLAKRGLMDDLLTGKVRTV